MNNTPNSSCVKQPLYLESSETTREASFFDFYDYQLYVQKKTIPLNPNYCDFLTWFIGFSEGDGRFFFTEKRLFFVINQKNPQILYKIRTELGFGIVRKYTQQNQIYYRFAIDTQQNILKLIYLFNGNLVLDKVSNRFQNWVDKANQLWKLSIDVKPKQPKVTLNNAWLSGFIEADGGFYARVRKKSTTVLGYQLNMKFYITQEGELETLQQIKDLLQSENNLRQFSQNSRFYNRLEITSFFSHSILVNYLEHYPCKGEKNVVIHKWKKMYWLREKKEHLTLSGIQKLRQLSNNFIQNQKKIEDIVHPDKNI